jgi:hypothetical protein
MGVTKYKSTFHTYLDSDKAWDIIENKVLGYDVDIDDLYPESFIVETTSLQYGINVQLILLEGEEYVLLEGDCDNYCITSFGRVLNCKYLTQNTVYFGKNNRVTTQVRSTKILLGKEFSKQGWTFNSNNIQQIYDKYEWRYCKAKVFYHTKK